MAVINNLVYVHKIGENGVLLTATLSDRSGEMTLTGYTVTLNVARGDTLLVDDAPCALLNQTTHTGQVTCEIDNAFDVLTREENLKAEFKVVGGGVTEYFPKNSNNKRTYLDFEVQKSLG